MLVLPSPLWWRLSAPPARVCFLSPHPPRPRTHPPPSHPSARCPRVPAGVPSAPERDRRARGNAGKCELMAVPGRTMPALCPSHRCWIPWEGGEGSAPSSDKSGGSLGGLKGGDTQLPPPAPGCSRTCQICSFPAVLWGWGTAGLVSPKSLPPPSPRAQPGGGSMPELPSLLSLSLSLSPLGSHEFFAQLKGEVWSRMGNFPLCARHCGLRAPGAAGG